MRNGKKQAHAKDFLVSFVVPSHWNAECGTENAEGKSKSWLLLVEGEAAFEDGETRLDRFFVVFYALVLLDLIERRI